VETDSETKSVSHETTFSRDVSDGVVLRRTLRQLSEEVGRSLRQKGLQGTTIKLKLRWADFTTFSRQLTRDSATLHDAEIYADALELFERLWIPGQPVRLIGVGVSGFTEAGKQIGLWENQAAAEEAQRLEETLDELRDRFGSRIIRRGSDLLGKTRKDE
jgi:DNA polymerase-4